MRNQTHNDKLGVTFSRRGSAVPRSGGGRVVRLPEVLEITGLSRTTIWRRERDGSFPSPIRLGGERTRAVGWREQDIYDWIDGLSPAA
ncbi:MAG: AlpA family phage regulatory protein [bacterium]|nr:AlpA family phage regulatory protein [bacterium]